MPYKKQWKAHTIDYSLLSSLPNDDDSLYCLNSQDVSIIVAGLQSFRWRTRWENIDQTLSLPDRIDELEYKLLGECCDGVLNCILTDDRIQKAIQQIINDYSVGSGADNLADGIATLDGCNPDNVFGAITELVSYLDRSARDAFEIIEVATNVLEVVADWLDLPAPTPWDAALNYVNWIQDSVMENYDAQWTTALADTYRCDLFCIYNENCEINGRDIMEYFAGRLTNDPLETLQDAMEFLVLGAWSGTQIVDAMLFGIMAWMTYREDDLTIGWITIDSLYRLKTVLALGANNPDPDWQILCQVCPATWDFSRLGGFEFENCEILLHRGRGTAEREGRGTYDALNDTVEGYYNGGDQNTPTIYTTSVRFEIDTGQPVDLTEVRMFGLTLSNVPTDNAMLYFELYDENRNRLLISFDEGAQTSHQWTGSISDVRYIAFTARSYNNIDAPLTARINLVTVYGEGLDKPIWM